MKILMLNYEFPPIGGGAGKAHLCLLKEYAGYSNMTVDVLTSAPKPGFFQEKFSENITICKVGVHKKNLHYWRKVEVIEWLLKAGFHYRRMLKKTSYDLVHAFFGFPTAYLCYRSANKLPYIISLRGSDVPGYNIRLGLDYKILAGLFRNIWLNAAMVVANSEGLRNLANEFTPGLNIVVISNAVDTAKFHPLRDKKPERVVKLLSVGRLISRKRIDLLIEAVALAKKEGLEVELNIAGDGNLMDELQRVAEKLKVDRQVNFLGRVPPEQMPDVYRNSNVFVMSSMHEGMSNAMLEAMASGLPIITTRCEGVEELIVDNGIVIEQAHPETIAGAIKKLAGNQQTCGQMSAAARKQAALFTWSSAASQYIEHYQKIMKNKKPD